LAFGRRPVRIAVESPRWKSPLAKRRTRPRGDRAELDCRGASA
jgi:hypothetical protein